MNTTRQFSSQGPEVPRFNARRAGIGIAAAALIVGSLAACSDGKPASQQQFDTETVAATDTTSLPPVTATTPPATTARSSEASATSTTPSTAKRTTMSSTTPRVTRTSESPTTSGPVVSSVVPLSPTSEPTTTGSSSTAASTSPENNGQITLADQAAAVAGRLSQFVINGEATMVTPRPVERSNYKTVYFMSKTLRAGSQQPAVTAQVGYNGTKIIEVDIETGNDILLPGENSDELNRTHMSSDELISMDGGQSGDNWDGSVYVGRDFYETPHTTPPGATIPSNVVLHNMTPNDMPSYTATLLNKF